MAQAKQRAARACWVVMGGDVERYRPGPCALDHTHHSAEPPFARPMQRFAAFSLSLAPREALKRAT
jgi:hypothetical protein